MNHSNLVSQKRRLSQLVLIALVAVYVLIFIGSLVRATGSGMGCPDWPMCFGSIIPPTSVSELPINYKELYPFYQHAEFSVFNTWTEYFNRLSGVSVGLLILLAWFYSLRLRKLNPKVAIMMSLTLFTTIFQGWLGSVVVGTHLSPLMISFHMLLAQSIALMMVYAYLVSLEIKKVSISLKQRWGLIFVFIVLLIQIIFGLLTRSAVDVITNEALLSREQWSNHLSFSFDFHRLFAVVVVFLISFSFLHLYKTLRYQRKLSPSVHLIKKSIIFALLLAFVLFIVGMSLVLFNFPFLLQPVHLGLASILLGLFFTILLLTRASVKNS